MIPFFNIPFHFFILFYCVLYFFVLKKKCPFCSEKYGTIHLCCVNESNPEITLFFFHLFFTLKLKSTFSLPSNYALGKREIFLHIYFCAADVKSCIFIIGLGLLFKIISYTSFLSTRALCLLLVYTILPFFSYTLKVFLILLFSVCYSRLILST